MRFGSLVLCYHAVSDTWDDPLATAATTLEAQVKLLLSRGYRAVSAEGALANRQHTLHVTFDDAFRNVAGALAALERLRVPATIFACAGLADDGAPLRVAELRDRAPANGDELLTMSWDTLREVTDHGVEIGSHTLSHPHLPVLGEDELRRELRESRERVEDQLRRACRLLAYPYGQHDARVRAAARAAGYTAAFALDPPTGAIDPWAVPRVGVYRADTLWRFTLKTTRLRQPVMAARAARRSKPA
jgi:peptidoglycan/xylan/chitin deacetylase (PgdA/CDA1 family)